MKTSTPFFPGFHHILFGRAPRSAQQKLHDQTEKLRRASLSQLAKLFVTSIPPAQLATQGKQRSRCFPLAITFWAFLSQTLNPGSSCRESLRKIQGGYAAHKLSLPDSNTGAYCKARRRLDPAKLRALHLHTAQRLQAQVNQQQLWCERPVKVVDGPAYRCPIPSKIRRLFRNLRDKNLAAAFPLPSSWDVFA